MSNEKALNSENLIPYSNDLSQSVWTKRNLTVPATNITAPDGTSSASSLLENSSTATHDFYEEFSAVSGTSYTFTLYAKANGRDTLRMKPQATSTIALVVFDLTAVTSTVISGSADSHSITAIGSTGWYKLQVTVTATASGTGFLQTYFEVGGLSSYAGDATKGAYIWGCQVSSTGETVLNETSGSIHREYSPLLKTAAADAPRFEYAADGQSEGSGTALGLKIEAQATNLQRYGSDFSSWGTRANLASNSNQAIAPNGQLEADLLVPTTGNDYHYIFDGQASVTSGNVYTFSVYLKSAGYRYAQLLALGPLQSSGHVTFDLMAGTLSASGAHSGTIESVGNGWYRASATVTATSTTTSGFLIAGADSLSNGRNPQTTGNAYDGWLAWGAQFETGSAASSLVDTGSLNSTISRAADSCSVDLSQINYSGGEYTLIADADTLSDDNVFVSASLYKDNSNFAALYANGLYGRTVVAVSDGVNSTVNGGSANGRIAASGGTNSLSVCVNGGAVTTDTSYTVPDLAGGTLYLGTRNGSSSPLNGNIKRLSLYSVALSDTELQALSS